MTEVSTNLPVVASEAAKVSKDIRKAEYAPQYIKSEIEEMDLERIPSEDFVDFSPENQEYGRVMCMAKMPNPEEVAKGIGVMTTILIGLKSLVEAGGDLWRSIKDNFNIHKNEEMVKQAYKQMAEQRTAEFREAA